LLLIVLCSAQHPCNVVASDGSTYDLSRLAALGTISATDENALWTYTVSVCGNRVSCGDSVTTGYCQKGTIGGRPYNFNVGNLDQTIAKPNGEGVELIYFEPREGRAGRVIISCVGTFENITANDNGTGVVLLYEEPVQGRKGQVHITCDPEGGLVSDITAISPPDKTSYSFHFKSYAACPISTTTCKATADDGSAYDLRQLVVHPPLWGADQWKEWNYTVSICQDTLSCFGVDPAGYCQFNLDYPWIEFCVGKFDSIQGLNNGAGVKLTYKDPTEGRIGTVTITCDPNGPVVSGITAISPDKIEDYEFNFKSSAACPKQK